jgi:hypothetical protein
VRVARIRAAPSSPSLSFLLDADSCCRSGGRARRRRE